MKKIKEEKGITLVALIITIVVLLILAMVGIGAVKDSKIIAHSQNATSSYEKGKGEENNVILNMEELLNRYSSNMGGISDINVEDYGKKVVGYSSKGQGLENLVWRIFYHDSNNVYLISETEDKQYPITNLNFYDWENDSWSKREIIKKYTTSKDISEVGKKMMPMARAAFEAGYENLCIPITAYLCDTEVWEDYTDSQGNAIWAIGSPTIELFTKSFNAVQSNISISIEFHEDGYMHDTSPGTITTQEINQLYLLDSVNEMVIASPSEGDGQMVLEGRGKFGDGLVAANTCARPVVCIPIEKFNNANYTLE